MPDDFASYPRPASGANQPERKQLPKGVVWKTVDLIQFYNTDDQLWLTKERQHAVYEKSGLPYIDARTGKTAKKIRRNMERVLRSVHPSPPHFSTRSRRYGRQSGTAKQSTWWKANGKAKALEAWGYIATTNEHGAYAWTDAHAFLLLGSTGPTSSSSTMPISRDRTGPMMSGAR